MYKPISFKKSLCNIKKMKKNLYLIVCLYKTEWDNTFALFVY